MRHSGLAVLLLALALAGLQSTASGRALQQQVISTANATNATAGNATAGNATAGNGTRNATSPCNATLFEVLNNQPELSSLLIFVESLLSGPYGPNVTTLLNNTRTENITIFAPTGGAFIKLLEALSLYNATDLLADPDLQLAILLTHIVPGRLSSANITNNTVAPTLVGVNLTFALTHNATNGTTIFNGTTSFNGTEVINGTGVMNSTAMNSTGLNSTHGTMFNNTNLNGTRVNETLTNSTIFTSNSTTGSNSTGGNSTSDNSTAGNSTSGFNSSSSSNSSSHSNSTGGNNTVILVEAPGSTATIVKADLCFDNHSLVHVVDNILLPAPVEGVIPLYYRLAANQNFTLLTAAIDLVSIAAEFSGSNQLIDYRAVLSSPVTTVTLFAPDNQAFKTSLNVSTAEDLALNFGIATLNSVLAVHVVPNEVIVPPTPGTNFTTVGNTTTTFTQDQNSNTTLVQNQASSAPLLDYLIATINGIAYPIGALLFPVQG